MVFDRDNFLKKFKVAEADLQKLCQQIGVTELYIFGSALEPRFVHGESDLDFLVDFNETTFDAFFDLQEGLKTLFNYQNIDLVTLGSLKNPFIKEEIFSSREMIYAA